MAIIDTKWGKGSEWDGIDKILDPMRRQPHPVACRLTRPREALQQVLSPTFRCWLGKRISPSMTLVTLKCDSVPWANYFTQDKKDLSVQVFKLGTSSNSPSLPKNPTPSRATALLHLPYTLPQLLIQGAQLKNPVRPSPTVAPHTSHSYPAFCSPFSCAITCLPPRLTPKDLQLVISNSITCWIPTIPPLWTYRICRH